MTTPSMEISLRTSSATSLRPSSTPSVLEGVLRPARSTSVLLRPIPREGARRKVRRENYLPLLLLLPSIVTVYLLLGLLSFLLGKG